MDLQKILDQIRSKLGEKTPEIESFLKQIEANHNEISEDLKAANGESKTRKLKIRELEQLIEDSKSEIENLKKKTDDPIIKQELEALRSFKADLVKKQRETFIAEFDKVKGHANFEKAKDLFKLPKAKDDGSLDLTKLKDDEIDFNVAKLAELQKLDYFGQINQQNPPPFNNMRTNTPGDPNVANISNKGDLENIIKQAAKVYNQ